MLKTPAKQEQAVATPCSKNFRNLTPPCRRCITVPPLFLKSRRTAKGTWGKISLNFQKSTIETGADLLVNLRWGQRLNPPAVEEVCLERPPLSKAKAFQHSDTEHTEIFLLFVVAGRKSLDIYLKARLTRKTGVLIIF